MSNREYAAGIVVLLSDRTVAAQALAVSALLDAATHRPQPQWSPSQQGEWGSDDTFIGFGGGGAAGPEHITWQNRAWGYDGGRDEEQRFTAEVGLHAPFEFDLAPVAAALGLELSGDRSAYIYRVDTTLAFPSFLTARSDDARMLTMWLKRSGMGEPLGASNKITGRVTWIRRHWRFKQREASLWDKLTGGKLSKNMDTIESDLLTWAFDTGDVTTQFAARPVQPVRTDPRSFIRTIDAARRLAERVQASLRSAPINGEALRRRLSLDDAVEGPRP
jgi:hypothetical protein